MGRRHWSKVNLFRDLVRRLKAEGKPPNLINRRGREERRGKTGNGFWFKKQGLIPKSI